MTHPNELVETIEKALNQEIPVEWHRDGPTWLRALLEENAALRKSRDIEIKEADAVRKQLQQTREELEKVKSEWNDMSLNFSAELRATRELDRKIELLEEELGAQSDEIESLRIELSAKDKVLEGYANTEASFDRGQRAHSILSHYPPRREEDDQT